MSREQCVAAALNDLKHLFCAEDQAGLEEVALDYFVNDSQGVSDQEDSEVVDSDEESTNEHLTGQKKSRIADNNNQKKCIEQKN